MNKSLLELKEEFINKYESAKNKEAVIDIELRDIDNFIKSIQHADANRGSFKAKLYSKLSTKFSDCFLIHSKWSFLKGYDDFLINELEPKEDNTSWIEDLQNGCTFAMYRIFVESYLKNNISRGNHGETSTNIQLLILQYLGLNNEALTQDNRAKLFSKILNRSEQTIRPKLSYLGGGNNDIRSKNNLQTVAKIFKQSNLIELEQIVKKDILKLKK